MDTLLYLLSLFFIILGSITILIGSFGLIRLPDVYSRIHAVGMIDTAGAGLLKLRMVIYSGRSMTYIKI